MCMRRLADLGTRETVPMYSACALLPCLHLTWPLRLHVFLLMHLHLRMHPRHHRRLPRRRVIDLTLTSLKLGL